MDNNNILNTIELIIIIIICSIIQFIIAAISGLLVFVDLGNQANNSSKDITGGGKQRLMKYTTPSKKSKRTL